MSMYQAFIERDIKLHNPTTITLDMEPEQIAAGTEIFPGCRISGKSTSIGPHCRIGTEGPVTLQDCQLGENVTFTSGFAKQATMLDGVTIGANAHIRPGTLLEEQVCLAHCVGLKQTLLLPFVTLGSLINFCDCLMAGGTIRSHHSEVGSFFVHFNFTPRQDKATPSLFGDVPSGVLLDQPPIFLGGQCGVVGPVRIAYGTILPAGSICRKDVLEPGTIHTEKAPAVTSKTTFDVTRFGNIDRIVRNNLIYIGNLHALYAWYQNVRQEFMVIDPFPKACWQGACKRIQQMTDERIKQLEKLATKAATSPSPHPTHAHLTRLLAHKGSVLALSHDMFEGKNGAWGKNATMQGLTPLAFMQYNREQQKTDYLSCIQSMPPDRKQEVRAWLQSFIENITSNWEHCTNA